MFARVDGAWTRVGGWAGRERERARGDDARARAAVRTRRAGRRRGRARGRVRRMSGCGKEIHASPRGAGWK